MRYIVACFLGVSFCCIVAPTQLLAIDSRFELNPDELVWTQLKHPKIGKLVINGPAHLKRHIIGFLRAMQKMPALVRPLFHHPSVRYAA